MPASACEEVRQQDVRRVTLFEAVVLERLAPASRLSVRVQFFLELLARQVAEHSGVQGSRSQIMGWILGSKSGRRNQTWPGGVRQGFCALVLRKKEGIEASSVSSTGSSLQKRKA